MNPRNLESLGSLVLSTSPLMRPPQLATIDLKNGDAVRQWLDVKRAYEEVRGVRPAANNKWVPKTLVRDVVMVRDKWTDELRKVRPRNGLDVAEHERWAACVDRVNKAIVGRKPEDMYLPKPNEEFWQRCTRRLAIYLESRKVVPSRWRLALNALSETLAEVPPALGNATRSSAQFAADIVREPAKLAAVILGGAILIPSLVRAVRG